MLKTRVVSSNAILLEKWGERDQNYEQAHPHHQKEPDTLRVNSENIPTVLCCASLRFINEIL